MATQRVTRVDHGTVRGVVKTPQGGVRVAAALTRTGVLRYSDGQGNTWGEYRPPAEVFAADSLATLRGAPVTDLHPSDLVTAETWKQLAVGHVGDDVAPEGDFVVGDVLVQDAAEVAMVERRERVEVSCGYTCEVDPTPGVTPAGERYDRVQRSIRYNHAGLGPEGWGRAGSQVALRLDGAALEVRAPAGAAVEVRADSVTEEIRMKNVLKFRGREFKLDAAEDVAAAQGAVDELAKKADADNTELAAVKAALMDALQKVAALEAKQAAAAAAVPPASAPITEESIPEDVLDSAIEKRTALHAGARKVLGADADLKGKKPAEIKRMVVAKVLPTTKLDGLSAPVIDGMFVAVTADGVTAARNDALAETNRAAAGGGETNDPARRDDGDDEDPFKKMCRDMESTSRAPLSADAAKGA